MPSGRVRAQARGTPPLPRWRTARTRPAGTGPGDAPPAPPGLAAAILAALPAQPPRAASRVPLGPAALALLLLGALWWERLRFASWLVPLAGTGLAALGAALGRMAAAAAGAAPVAAAVLPVGLPALALLVAVEVPVCALLLRPRPHRG